MTSLFSREITITDLCCIYVRICSGQLISMHHYLYDNEGQGVSNFGEDTQNNYIVHTIKKIMMLIMCYRTYQPKTIIIFLSSQSNISV